MALAFLQRLATEVSEGTIDLPCFPDVVIRISQALADPNTTPEGVVTVVGAEPRLAARVLQTANSAAFNSSGKPLSDLRSAIIRLGQQMVQSTAMAYALQNMKNEAQLRSFAQPLAELWNKSIAVASICKLLAARTKVPADEAFLTGLVHGIGNLYIMARAAGAQNGLGPAPWMELIGGWQASIGQAVLQSWGFAEELCEAVGEQDDLERRFRHEARLSDILVAGLLLAEAQKTPEPRSVRTEGVNAFLSLRLNSAECIALLSAADERIREVLEALS